MDPATSQSELARLVGGKCKPQTIQGILSGGQSSSKYVPRIAFVLGCDATWLADGDGKPPTMRNHNSSQRDASITAPEEGVITESAVKRENTMGFSNIEPGPDVKGVLPLISWVQAGNWEAIVDNFAPGDAEEWRPSIIASHGHGFFLRVRGESMYNPDGEPSFRHNDIIQVEPARWADNGSLVIVRLDDEKEATFKQLIIEGEKKYLKALNPSWPERIMQVNGNATICGVVRAKVVTYG